MKKVLCVLMCSTVMVFAATANARVHKNAGPVGEPPRHEQMAKRLADDLGLTAEQREKADKIREDGQEKIKPLMEKVRKLHEKMDKLRKENMKEFEKILTPEQQEKFAKIKAEMDKHKGPRGPKAPRPGMKKGPHHSKLPLVEGAPKPEDLPKPID